MFWFCAINNEISTSFLAKKLRGIINSDMLQGSSNTRSLFLCFFFYLTWLLGCYCKIIHIRTVTTGSDTLSLWELFSPSDLILLPNWVWSQAPTPTYFYKVEWKKEWTNGRLLCARRQSRGSGGPVIPGTACSAARLSLAQNPGTSLGETSAGNKWRLHQCIQKELVLRLKDYRHFPNTFKLP